MKSPLPSLRRVALEAGVSIATASRALAQSPLINAETAKAVQRAAVKLGYRPDPLVSKLKRQVRSLVYHRYQGSLVFLTNYRDSDYIKNSLSLNIYKNAATHRAAQLGYTLETLDLKHEGLSGKRATEILLSRGSRGLLLAPLQKPFGHLSLHWKHFVAVTLGHAIASPQLDSIHSNHFESVITCCRNLKRLGHSRIGMALHPDSDRFSRYQLSSAFWHVQETMLQTNRIPPFYNDIGHESSFKMFSQWMKNYQPNAIIGMDPILWDWIRRQKSKTLQTCSFANCGLLQGMQDIAGVLEKSEGIAIAGTDLLINRIEREEFGPPENPLSVSVQGTWMDGSSAPNNANGVRKGQKF